MTESVPLANRRNDQRRWAGQTLDIPFSSSPESIRRELLEKLSDEEFVPPDHWHDAIDTLLDGDGGKRAVLPPGYYATREQELRDEINKFAVSFFELPPPQRQQQWHRLYGVSKPWPPLRHWLEQLESGLDVIPESTVNSAQTLQTLANLIRDGFVLPPRQRSQVLLEKLPPLCLASPHLLKIVIKALRQDYPQISKLNEKLLQDLTGKFRTTREPIDHESGTLDEIFGGGSDQANRSSLVMIWLVLALLMGLLRSCSAYNSYSRQRHVEIIPPPAAVAGFARIQIRQATEVRSLTTSATTIRTANAGEFRA